MNIQQYMDKQTNIDPYHICLFSNCSLVLET